MWRVADVTEVWETAEQQRQTYLSHLQFGETRLKSPAGQRKKLIHRRDRSRSPAQPVSDSYNPWGFSFGTGRGETLSREQPDCLPDVV